MQNIYTLGLVGLEEDFLKFSLIIPLVAIATRILHGMKFFEQLWKPFNQGSILPSLVEIGLVVITRRCFKFTIIINYTRKALMQSIKGCPSKKCSK
jgi:hypothetical protein